MAEKDPSVRLRRAVKGNNLFLVKRLVKRTDMRNPDPTYRRYTSLAWAAVLGHEETFEWLLNNGHDDQEVSRPQDSLGNTILILLAEAKPPLSGPHSSGPSEHDFYSATLRMARMYFDRFPDVLDWANAAGRTAIHAAALKGNEDILRMLCDIGADFDLADNDGNTPLHFASAWGHRTIVQLLIERGCQYSVRNNDGFTPSDYAYSTTTKELLQDTARAQFELNKKARRNVQATVRGNEWTSDDEQFSARARILNGNARMRSGSGTSRTTATSDSGGDWNDNQSTPGQIRHIAAPPPFTSSPSRSTVPLPLSASSTSTNSFSIPSPSPSSTLAPSTNTGIPTGLSPIASRMRERDAEAMEKYKLRQRSGSAATTSTDTPSLNGSIVSSGNASVAGEDVTSLNSFGSFAPRRRLRPSASAAQLSNGPQPLTSPVTPTSTQDSRNRAGTSPGILRRQASTSTAATSPPSESSSVLQTPTQASSATSRQPFFRSVNGHGKEKDKEKDHPGPSPPAPTHDTPERERSHTPTLLHSRRLPFNLLSHKHSTDHHHFGHKRNPSANSLISRT